MIMITSVVLIQLVAGSSFDLVATKYLLWKVFEKFRVTDFDILTRLAFAGTGQ